MHEPVGVLLRGCRLPDGGSADVALVKGRITFPTPAEADGWQGEQIAGERATIIGPSGCGKSTLLRIFANILEASAGEVRVGGVSPSEASYQFHIPTMWATIFTASLMALTAFFLVSLVERRVTRWARNGAFPE